MSQYDSARISRLADRLINGITSQLDQVIRNGDPKETYNGHFVRNVFYQYYVLTSYLNCLYN